MEKFQDYLEELSQYNNGMLFDVTQAEKEALKQNDQHMAELINQLDTVIQEYADSDSQAVQQMVQNYYKPEEAKQKWNQEYNQAVMRIIAGHTA